MSWKPDLIVIDEAHHTSARTWQTVLDSFPNAWRLGVTATPERLDGKGLGDLFEELVLGPSVTELQGLGFLCSTKYYVPKTIDRRELRTTAGDFRASDCEAQGRKILGDVVAAYNRFAGGMRAVAFCSSIAHAEAQAEAFGEGWEVISSKLNAQERRRMVERFTAGETIGLTSVDVISEGFDLPAIGAAILLRPTQSLGMHLQQIGRALRPFPGKPHAVIIDHVNNLLVHGLAEDERDWSLEGHAGERSTAKMQATKRCPECFVLMPPGCSACPECGHVFTSSEPRQMESGEAEMVELTDREQKKARMREFVQSLGRKANLVLHSRNLRPPLLLREWEGVADACEYAQGWAWHTFQKQKSSLKS
jgi:superfamily II DNA or RNA helicase